VTFTVTFVFNFFDDKTVTGVYQTTATYFGQPSARLGGSVVLEPQDLLDDRCDVARVAGEVDAQKVERAAVRQVGRTRDHSAARHHRDDGAKLHKFVAVEVKERGKKARHRKQPDDGETETRRQFSRRPESGTYG
jgi:hypothetical protein